MGNKRKFSVLEIFSILYFVVVLFVSVCKFGLFFKPELREKIFEIFYYFGATTIFGISIITILIFLAKSKKIRNIEENMDCSINIVSGINVAVISFNLLASIFGTIVVKEIAFEWLQIIIYFNIVSIIIDQLVYFFVKSCILKNTNNYLQREIVNKYIIYSVVSGFMLGIIIPNIMLHFGIIGAIRTM